MSDAEAVRCLRTGEQAASLREYFGDREYEQLRELAREAVRSRRGGERTLILPGIMGSTLGVRGPIVDDVLWLDPIDIGRGRIARLALPKGASYEPLGVILFTYLKLKLLLQLAGFDAEFYPFDWRQSIIEQGKAFAAFLDGQSASRVHVVAHSMGGLVTRAAIPHLTTRKLGRFVMLGTPNYGSFVPVQALRGRYSIVAKLAALDLVNDTADWAKQVLHTFPGLHEMLPFPEKFSALDLFSADTWQGSEPRPRPSLLSAARRVHTALAPADERFHLIAGVSKDTLVGLEQTADGFVYQRSDEGDGTVPLALCLLPRAKTYYVEENHGSLPHNAAVTRAVIDLLGHGDTDALPTSWSRTRSNRVRSVSESSLVFEPFEGRRAGALAASDRRTVLVELAAPESPTAGQEQKLEDVVVSTGYAHRFQELVVTRRREHAFELNLALGSITEANARCLVLGMFTGVEPAGAAQALDEALEGAVKEFSSRRMFSARVGQVFVLPTGRTRMLADSVLFAGLGEFGSFSYETLEFVAENIVRTLVRSHVDDFAVVLLGAASGRGIEGSLQHLLKGFVRGLVEVDTEHRVRRITLCELEPDRYQRLKEEAYRLASTSLFDDVQVTLCESVLPARDEAAFRRGPQLHAEPQTVYLYLTQEERERIDVKRGRHSKSFRLRSSLLTPASKAAVLSADIVVDPKQVDAILARIPDGKETRAWLRSLGKDLAGVLLPEDIRRGLLENKRSRLVVVHDARASLYPWEALCITASGGPSGDWFPAEGAGLSRHYAAANLSVAKWLERRRIGNTLDVLLVVNPTEDLDGALDEAERLEEIAARNQAVRLTKVLGPDATRARLLSEFGSGNYDVIHYAGHAFFDPEVPSSSGVVCHGEVVLSGAHLASLPSLPALAFFNACEAGRIRGVARASKKKAKPPEPPRKADPPKRISENVGLAEAFLRGGVACYVGTYWPVGDETAAAFSAAFYESLLAAKPIGEAVRAGRQRAGTQSAIDWADYIHYGDPDFVLKTLGSG